ncbi:MAG: PEP-CTERM sorting domain-containing protein [Luteolibacter sp.]
MKPTLLLLSLALAASCHAATVATVAVWAGSVSGNPADTFTRLSTAGGYGTGTRIGIASTTSAAREVAGTSNSTVWTITEAGTITVTYYLDNTVNGTFRPGIQGLYDATSGLAASASAVNTALSSFASLSGVTATTTPSPYPSSLDTGAGTVGAPAELFTTTYVIAPGSAAIGKTVAIGFYSSWNGAGGYIFGSEAGANNVVIDFVPVPEPSAALLGGLGLFALMRRRR